MLFLPLIHLAFVAVDAQIPSDAITQQQLADCQCDIFFEVASACQNACSCQYLLSTVDKTEACVACLGGVAPTNPFVSAISLTLSSIFGNCATLVSPVGNKTSVCSDFEGVKGCVSIKDGSAVAEAIENGGITISGSIQCSDCHATPTGSILAMATATTMDLVLTAETETYTETFTEETATATATVTKTGSKTVTTKTTATSTKPRTTTTATDTGTTTATGTATGTTTGKPTATATKKPNSAAGLAVSSSLLLCLVALFL